VLTSKLEDDGLIRSDGTGDRVRAAELVIHPPVAWNPEDASELCSLMLWRNLAG
jgi:hypothetical protein